MPPVCNYHFVEVLWCSMKVPTNKGVSLNHFGAERHCVGQRPIPRLKVDVLEEGTVF